jgi:hypothetical protein
VPLMGWITVLIAEAILCNMAFRMVLLLSSMCYQVISCAEHSVFKPLKIHYKSIFQYSICRNSMLFCPSKVHMKEKSLEAMLENGWTCRCYICQNHRIKLIREHFTCVLTMTINRYGFLGKIY